MALLEVHDVSKSYGSLTAVAGISFSTEAGEGFGLLGPSGAGKLTTISMIVGLTKPSRGSISVSWVEVTDDPVRVKAMLGFVPQEVALNPSLAAAENLSFWGKMYGLAGNMLRTRVREALEIAGLTDRASHTVGTFSGGMKRRLNVAVALLHRPALLVMGEPTVGVDPQSRTHVLDSLLSLNKQGVTVLYTSHYMEEVECLCTRIGITDRGKIIALGTKDELRESVGDHDEIRIQAGDVAPAALDEDELVVRASPATSCPR